MSYYGLTELQYKKFKEEIIEANLIEGPHFAVGNFKQVERKLMHEYNTVELPQDREVWFDASTPGNVNGSVSFKNASKRFFGTAMKIAIPRTVAEASMSGSEGSLITIAARQIMRRLDKYLEALTFQGPLLEGGISDNEGTYTETRLAASAGGFGLRTLAGNTSTYTTVKWASASGPYNTVVDMKGLLIADGHGLNKPLDLVVDTTLAPYLMYLPATDASFSEGSRIKAELLNGGNIYVSDQLGAAESNDGVALLIERNPLAFETLSSGPGFQLVSGMIYDPETDYFIGRIAGEFSQGVYLPNAICKHVTVDLA